MENTARLAALGREYVENVDKQKDLEDRRAQIKEEIASILKEEGTAYMVVPVGETEIFKFKNNYRATKSFDKDSLAVKIGWDREDLDYKGVSRAVERAILDSETVGKYQATNTSTFITVKTKQIKPAKKGR